MTDKQDESEKVVLWKPYSNVFCPVCKKHRAQGSHAKCSRVTALKYMRERGEIKQYDKYDQFNREDVQLAGKVLEHAKTKKGYQFIELTD